MIGAERETVVNITDDDAMVRIWTCRQADINHLSKKVTPAETGAYADGTQWARFLIPRTGYDVARGIKSVRTLTEDQRKALSDRLQRVREAGRS